MALSRRLLGSWSLALLGGALLSGCVVVPAGGRHGGGHGGYGVPDPDVDDGVVVGVAPPPAYVEVIPVAPGPGYFWVGGYWTWNLGRHLWVGGRWAPNRPGYAWNPHRWQPQGGRWRESRGHWGRRR